MKNSADMMMMLMMTGDDNEAASGVVTLMVTQLDISGELVIRLFMLTMMTD